MSKKITPPAGKITAVIMHPTDGLQLWEVGDESGLVEGAYTLAADVCRNHVLALVDMTDSQWLAGKTGPLDEEAEESRWIVENYASEEESVDEAIQWLSTRPVRCFSEKEFEDFCLQGASHLN